MKNKKRICVKDVMKSTYGTINRDATIVEALIEMKRLQTAVLVVNKRDENDEYGLYWCQTSHSRYWPRIGQPAG